MPFNGPIDGTDYTNVDFSKGPWANECMTLTHDEVLMVKEKCQKIIDEYEPQAPYFEPVNDMYVISHYCQLDKYEYAINGNTYTPVMAYDPEINTLGIDIGGIVYPEPEQLPEEPTEEPPAEEVDEPAIEEEPTEQ